MPTVIVQQANIGRNPVGQTSAHSSTGPLGQFSYEWNAGLIQAKLLRHPNGDAGRVFNAFDLKVAEWTLPRSGQYERPRFGKRTPRIKAKRSTPLPHQQNGLPGSLRLVGY
jgi:hypothetical protein